VQNLNELLKIWLYFSFIINCSLSVVQGKASEGQSNIC